MTGWKHTTVPEVAKVQRFHLTLTGETRLWYESLGPIVVDWTGLQEHFRHSSTQNLAICKNSYFMYGDHFIIMKMQKQLMHM